jgi:imidazolonepropionase-like amidohydrolase
MGLRSFAIAPLLLLAACAPAPESHSKAFLGAVLIDGAGGPPLSNSIVVTAAELIRSVGPRSAIPIPAEADKIDGGGKCIVPTPIDACDRADPPGMLHAGTPEEARRQVADFAARKLNVIYMGKVTPEVAEAALEMARNMEIATVPLIWTLAEARFLVDHGAAGFIGTIEDTEDLDPAELSHWRDLRIVFAPALVGAGAGQEVAKRNTRRLFESGVPIAAASKGGDLQREIELLVEAGLPPLDAIVAATRNSAVLLRRSDQTGTIAPGKRADLLVLNANPGEDIRNLRKVALRLSGGEWVKKGN